MKYIIYILCLVSMNGFGQLIPGVVASSGTKFDIYSSWTFEDIGYGEFTTDTFQTYFYQASNTSTWVGEDSIEDATINGLSTKVLKVFQEEWKLSEGIQAYTFLDVDSTLFDEIYASYNFKLGENWCSTHGGKLPALVSNPDPGVGSCPAADEGFYYGNLFQYGNKLYSYHWDHSGIGCPWSSDTARNDSIYFAPDTWYNYTERLVKSSKVGGVDQGDGILEIFIDGRMILQEDYLSFNDTDSLGIDVFKLGSWYGGGTDAYRPTHDCYVYFDNIVVWMPKNDSISGFELHARHSVLPTPVRITDKSFGYKTLINTATNFETASYPSNLDSCSEVTYLIDAGVGNTVELDITAGTTAGGTFLFFYNGKNSDDPLIDWLKGYDGDLSDNWPSNIVSTGRYMYFRISTDNGTRFTKLQATTTFNAL